MTVSLMADHVVRDPEGLCSARFHADILTQNVDYTTLSVGDAVTVGDATYIISRVGKRCHDECPLVQDGRTCPIKSNCAFAVRVRERHARRTRERARTHD